jgi:hypothetical protein
MILYLLSLREYIATTHYALRTGIGTEANPLLRRLFDRFGREPVLLDDYEEGGNWTPIDSSGPIEIATIYVTPGIGL